MLFSTDSGECIKLAKGKIRQTLTPQQNFGNLDLIRGSPRTTSIKIVQKSTFWALTERLYKTATHKLLQQQIQENYHIIHEHQFFCKPYPSLELRRLSPSRRAPARASRRLLSPILSLSLFCPSLSLSLFCLSLSLSLSVSVSGPCPRERPGERFQCCCFSLCKRVDARRLRSPQKQLEIMSEQQKNELVSTNFTYTFKIGETIAAEDQVSESFFIIKKGSVLVKKGDKEVIMLDEGSEFGNKQFL